MNMEMSSNTKAILLLTAPLLLGRGKRTNSVKPLSVSEYDRLARRLHECNWQPADLLGPKSGAILHESLPGLDDERINQLLERGFLLSQAIDHWQTRAIWVLSRADPDYPDRFKRRLGGSAPPVLYGCGDATLLENGGLAVVGSRNADDELMEYAESIGHSAAESQCTVISGGARGIDYAAMHGALTEWGTVVGILADGLEKAAMERGNRDVLMDNRLVLISPYDPKAGFNVGNAMQRNKLVYALADAGLVIESDYNKGGTWAGAVEQLDKLSLVPIYVRSKGDISNGLRALERRGALPWPNPATADDFRGVIDGKQPHQGDKAIKQSAFSLDCGEVVIPSQGNKEEPIVQSAPAVGTENVQTATPADALLGVVEQLLASIEKPITASNVAEHLDVSKRQAGDWLKRLEQAGKYQRRNKRAPYERVVQLNPLFH
ncbi:MAG: DNA-processing protein DprA [Chloroflexi bacterium]|nr:DNA-processing protein DprA [Chloroflexota bacterium]